MLRSMFRQASSISADDLAMSANLVRSGIADLIVNGDCNYALFGDSNCTPFSQTTLAYGIMREWAPDAWRGMACLAPGSGALNPLDDLYLPAGYSGAGAVEGSPLYVAIDQASVALKVTAASGEINGTPTNCAYNRLPRGYLYLKFLKNLTVAGDGGDVTVQLVRAHLSAFGDLHQTVRGCRLGDWTNAALTVDCPFGKIDAATYPPANAIKFQLRKPLGTVIGTDQGLSLLTFPSGDIQVLSFTRTSGELSPAGNLVPTGASLAQEPFSFRAENLVAQGTYAECLRTMLYLDMDATNENGTEILLYGFRVRRTALIGQPGFELDVVARGGISTQEVWQHSIWSKQAEINYMAWYQPKVIHLQYSYNQSVDYPEWLIGGGGVAYPANVAYNTQQMIASLRDSADQAGVARPKFLLGSSMPHADATSEAGDRPPSVYRAWSKALKSVSDSDPDNIAFIDAWAIYVSQYTFAQRQAITPDSIHGNLKVSCIYARIFWQQLLGALGHAA